MIKALSLAAALAVLPLSAALADPVTDPAEAAIEAAAERFEARMEAFSERAEAIGEDESLTKAQRDARIAALWSEYQPEVDAFTSVVAQHASSIAAAALADIDIEAVVAEALAAVEDSGALGVAAGIGANGAWASNDPEHLETMMLPAQYAVGEAMEAVDEAVASLAAPGVEGSATVVVADDD